jgi:hypothetical protein
MPAKRVGGQRPGPGATTETTQGRAKVFWSGRSQAIRLPRAFRVSTAEVSIRKEGDRLVLEPLDIERDEQGWPRAFWELAGSCPELDLGDRAAGHERGDILAPRRRR